MTGDGSLSLCSWSFSLLLSACAASTQPTNQPAGPPLADSLIRPLAASQLDHLQQAAYNYARYHALAPDDLLGLKRLAEVCAALEHPSTELRAGAGMEDESCREATERVAGMEVRNSQEELLDVPAEKADSHLPHIASLTRRHVCPVE